MNERSVVEGRRERTAQAWNLEDEIVLVNAGTPISIPGGADMCYPYRTHPDYRWLTESQREGGVIAYDPRTGWDHFEPPVTDTERVWGGGPPPIGRPLAELDAWLSERAGRSVLRLGAGAPPADEVASRLQAELLGVRRPKDEGEIAILRRAVEASRAGFAAAKEAIRPGATEREVQIELETAAFRAGADCMGYATIIGAGTNSAVFHGMPSGRVLGENEFVLIDAGAEVDGYTADVTRTFSSSGRFTEDQQWIYDAVLEALRRATDACRIGTEWSDVHLTAARSLAESLKKAGVLRCTAEEAVDSEAIALFFPHGVGHLVGLGVRDASGPAIGRKGDRRFGGITLRMDIPLGDRFLTTVEPGLYFIPALLGNPERREKFAEQVDWAEAERYVGLGGVRIEDNILVTADGPVNLTESIPK
ncbi:MAG: M24 family metallopeptidase [Fimbriimonas sp.]